MISIEDPKDKHAWSVCKTEPVGYNSLVLNKNVPILTDRTTPVFLYF